MTTDAITERRTAIRVLLVALGLPQLFTGLWAMFAPHSFYGDFPNNRGWVSALGPFDEHLVTDVGELFIGLGVLMVLAAIWMSRRVVYAALITWLLWALPHAIYHSFNLDALGTGDAVAQEITLAWTLIAPVIVIWLLGAPARAHAAAAPEAPGWSGRIAPVPLNTRNPIVRYTFRAGRRLTGKVPDPLRAYGHHIPLLLGYGMLEQATMSSHRVDERLKALAAVKTASLAGCEYCMDIGSALAAKAGVPEDDLRELIAYRESERLSELDKLVLDLTVGMTRTPVEVSDELMAQLREHFDEGQLVELANEIALENYRARFNHAFGIASQDFTAGAYCVPPAAAVTAAA